ncbi:60S ribosomal protein L35A [Hanseniaspora vineae]
MFTSKTLTQFLNVLEFPTSTPTYPSKCLHKGLHTLSVVFIQQPNPSFTNNIFAGVKAYELKTQSKEQLENRLVELKKELADLKVQKLSKPSLPKINDVRKSIARVLTVINLNQRQAVAQLYNGKKYQPKSLRAKKTRALRRALTKFEASQVTEKQRKRQIAFPQRKFAIKA